MELITKSFESQCIAFPNRVERVLATITTVQGAKDLLDKAAVMQQYAERLKSGVEIERPIAFGVLKIKAKIGELCPAKAPAERGRGNKIHGPLVEFNQSTIAAYRKLAAHSGKLEEYYQSTDDVPTQTDFLKSVASDKRSSKKKKQASRNGADADNLAAYDSDSIATVGSLDALTGRQFGTIYADPPWQYGNQGTRASTDNHYGTMSLNDICEMPVRDLVADDAHLHLWTTNAFLFDAKRVMDAWGFEYRSVFVWVKPQMGIGNYWRVSHEFLLLGIRGDAKRFKEKHHMSWGQYGRSKHSAKPEPIRSIIESVSPGPFLELFGRKPVQGWTVFGNQISDGVSDECLQQVS